ncbi:MAG: methyltransferase [Pseudomonadales bacterium]|nr:methyltransferase [Pseudomonadales bacterium]
MSSWPTFFTDHPAPKLPFANSRGAQSTWNQADHYALHILQGLFNSAADEIDGIHGLGSIAELDHFAKATTVAVVNDDYAALACAISHLYPQLKLSSYSDKASQHYNYRLNNVSTVKIFSIDQLAHCEAEIVVVKIPKQLDFLDYILGCLALSPSPQLNRRIVIATAMQKYLSRGFYSLLQQFDGQFAVLPGIKKAKAVCLSQESHEMTPNTTADDVNDVLLQTASSITVETAFSAAFQIRSFANVFSAKQLDIGSRFFLQHMPRMQMHETVIDLACGNGVLGIVAKKLSPKSQLHFYDDSHLAIASAKYNWQHYFADTDQPVNFYHSNCFFDQAVLEQPNLATILCNPPFHQGHNVSDHIAITMMQQSAKILSNGGILYLIGNRHLAYEQKLQRYFKYVNRVAENSKFIIYAAQQKF